MKTQNFIYLLMILFSANLVTAQKAYVNTNESSVEWLGKKIGGQHNGSIDMKSGYLTMENNSIVAGSIVIDMKSITNQDVENETYNQKLVGHLKSDDFFGVEKYPEASFTVTKSTEFSNGQAKLTGNLTIKDKTESISFDVNRTGNEYSAKVEIDRSKFDVRYGSTSFFDDLKDKAIDDIFMLDIKLVLN